jgi:hypothetical protein
VQFFISTLIKSVSIDTFYRKNAKYMVFSLSILSFACFIFTSLSKWTGHLSIPEYGLTLSNIKRIDSIESFNLKGYLCLGEHCKHPTILIHTNHSTEAIYNSLSKIKSSSNLIFGTSFETWVFQSPAFLLPEKDFDAITSHMKSSKTIKAKIKYYYECDF